MSALAKLVARLLLVAVEPFVRVEGSSGCPTPAEASRQLTRFLTTPAQAVGRGADVAAETHVASVDAVSGGVHLRLRRLDGTVLGDKVLALEASCAQMAEAVAVVLAVWELPLRPGLVSTFDQSAAQATSFRTSVVGAPPAGVGAVAAAGTSRGTQADAVLATGTDVAAARRREAWTVELGAGFRELVTELAPGALRDGIARSPDGAWGPRLTLGGAAPTDRDLAGGRVWWTRVSAGAGLIHRLWAGSRSFLEAHEQVLAAAFVAGGHGYDRSTGRRCFGDG